MVIVAASFETACLESPVSVFDIHAMEFRRPRYVFEFSALFVGLDKDLGKVNINLFKILMIFGTEVCFGQHFCHSF